MLDDLTFRPVAADESLDPLFALDETTFHHPVAADERANAAALIDRRGSLCAYDGETLVGTSAAYDLRLSVPGGDVRCSAISWVSVLPTHRRRGILRRMMTGQLLRAREQGVPVAALWASEAGIYGRFGFGPATESHETVVRMHEAGLRSGPDAAADGLRVRLIERVGAEAVVAGIYERARGRRGGMLARDAGWWTYEILAEPESLREEHGRLRVAIAGDGDEAGGYALYRTRYDSGTDTDAGGILQVDELVAISSAAERALWRYLLSIDLIHRLEAESRPVDDVLPLVLANPRAARRRVEDALWVRLVDLPGALAARTWAADVALTIEVEDELLPENAGRWRLHAGPSGFVCERTEREPDLRLPIAALGATYLGGLPLTRAVAAGTVEERTPGAAATLDRGLRPERAPWNVSVF